MMSKLPIFQLLVLFCWHSPLLDAFFFKSPITIKIINQQYWYPVGDSINIYCKTIDGIPDDLHFSDLLPTVPLSSTNYIVEAVNKSTILLKLSNVTVGRYNYMCQGAKTKKEHLDFGIASFAVGHPPEIENIQFESIDLKQLSVYLKPKINGTSEYWKTTWKLSENSIGDPKSDECGCSSASINCTCENPFNCTISRENCFNPNKTYNFTILGSNHFGLLNKTYSINPTEIVKLKELKNLETHAGVTSLSLSWSWKLQDLWPSNVKCNVTYKSYNGEWTISTIDSEITIKNLEPDTRYTLALQCKLQDSNYWSDVVTVHEKTSSSPLNISVENLKIIDVTDSDVILSWENPTIDSNIIYNLITYKAENNPEEFIVALPSQEFKLENLNSSTHYTLSIALCNGNGCSRKKSYIQFTTKKSELCSSLKLTLLSNNLLHVNWTYESLKRFHFIFYGKTHPLEKMNGFILKFTCQKGFPFELGVRVISEQVNGLTNNCEMNLKEVTMCQNKVFPIIDINNLTHESPNVSGNK